MNENKEFSYWFRNIKKSCENIFNETKNLGNNFSLFVEGYKEVVDSIVLLDNILEDEKVIENVNEMLKSLEKEKDNKNFREILKKHGMICALVHLKDVIDKNNVKNRYSAISW
ncbi:MAG: hypothetical protein NZZ41_00920 [Candidatus Dojkabacteria bacterium]|nr:hypothetical protein [Candidatus Dojkabacteria bacterium]